MFSHGIADRQGIDHMTGIGHVGCKFLILRPG
jgi:hypothetical protein